MIGGGLGGGGGEGNNRATSHARGGEGRDKLGNRRSDRNVASRTAGCKVSRRPIN